jgi:hypothetical protein
MSNLFLVHLASLLDYGVHTAQITPVAPTHGATRRTMHCRPCINYYGTVSMCVWGGGLPHPPPPPPTSRFRNNSCKDDSALFSSQGFMNSATGSPHPTLPPTLKGQ